MLTLFFEHLTVIKSSKNIIMSDVGNRCIALWVDNDNYWLNWCIIDIIRYNFEFNSNIKIKRIFEFGKQF